MADKPETKLTGWLGWVEERTGVVSLTEHEVLTKNSPKHRAWYDYTGCFGGMALVFFLIQILSGMFLLVYYVPHADTTFEVEGVQQTIGAFASVHKITSEEPMGWLVRRVHGIGSNFMLICVLIHLLRVLFTGAYKAPRELHWVSGVFLLFMLMAMNLSGYLLPWSQLSYWASAVATESPGAIPWVGSYVVEFMRGGAEITGDTLGRFFAIHVWILPAVMVLFLIAHFMMIRKTGINEPL
ncbi:MAG: cytochrome b N-terminal domain-containing protein [Phycisphaerae bacterium]|nr:cytochrome b N-terminal domain-containing protein [Phycisphaerae bacterium]